MDFSPSAASWAEPLRALAGPIEEDLNPQGLLEALRAGISQPELPTETDFVRVMSLHKSKGLTADLVVVVGLIEGLVPSKPDSNALEPERRTKLEEDRRVFYVALTRAKNTLLLSSVTTLSLQEASTMTAAFKARVGGAVRTVASRFLSDLGPQAPLPIRGDQIQ